MSRCTNACAAWLFSLSGTNICAAAQALVQRLIEKGQAAQKFVQRLKH
jgi:hypothetical protein